ncbi:substrate-binding periplasmic protein [Vibrio neptunius]|uniref:Transporter substrate-binding domain-containing protein n=1 Tax=Vibrio neptunius TaxID=170651 RepID=A0ABS3A1X9_9VIBR|nr:transporter substrate-binding domain-containing protein [Vibrio neptunius]MBN3492282.1 transporter substrate-binding domain-containing protein [Vibrio neptunius]MBN3514903.1 transporter substrate-binding domain-containing protein [Vibrio neptunius]MBN3549662.1 transporter substrate-binding domain-containing protein [Vibrio neptunius]MBN3576907.1 transporter substrate-binding domain-containing protein [Vibrio neptunius]MCH9870571.1 transporter substrate-binding domain-containing protein [Vib
MGVVSYFARVPLLSLMLLAYPFQEASAKTVTFVTDVWPPYVLDASSNQGKGFFVDLVVEMCESEGLKVEITYVPWLRAETMVKHGSAFAAFPYAVTQTRKQFADFSKALTQSANPPRIFYYLPLVPKAESISLQELMTYRVGTYLGYYIKEKLDEMGQEYALAQTEEQAFKLLQKGRIDYLPADPESGWKWIAKLFPDSVDHFDVLPEPFPGTSLHLMVSRSYPNAKEILALCESGFRSMIESGKYYEMLNNEGKLKYAIPSTK